MLIQDYFTEAEFLIWATRKYVDFPSITIRCRIYQVWLMPLFFAIKMLANQLK